MATIVLLHWPEATKEQYEEVQRRADWEGDTPAAARLHVVGWADDGMHISDVWESEDAFNAWFGERVQPAIEAIGIEGRPDVKFMPLHGIFAQAFGHSRQTATV